MRSLILPLVLPAALSVAAFAESASAQQWIAQGPRPTTQGQVENIQDGEVIGAVHDVAPHPSDANILYIGAANGGIWRTADALSTRPRWTFLTGAVPSRSIGALEFDRTDPSARTLVAGLGAYSNYYGLGGALLGVLRSTDGGAHWDILDGGGAITGLNISGIAARGPIMVFSASRSGFGHESGIWRSVDTGVTWRRISAAAGAGLPAGAAYDLVADPARPERLYTNAGRSGLYCSDDFGATWRKISNARVDARLTSGLNNIEFAIGPNGVVFVAIVSSGRLAALFRSPDAGQTWIDLDRPANLHPGGQGGNNLSIASDGANPDTVYVGGDRQPDQQEEGSGTGDWPNSIGARNYTARLFRVDASAPSGRQAAHITHSNTATGTAPHADSRDMAFDARGDLLEADDGGVYRRVRSGGSFDWVSLNGDLQITEVVSIAWDSVSHILIAGAQDAGAPHQGAAGNARMRDMHRGDGGDVAIDDPLNVGTSIRYSSAQKLGNFRRAHYGAGNTLIQYYAPALQLINSSIQFKAQFSTPIVVNQVARHRLVIGAATGVFESLDDGDTIAPIGPGIRTNAYSADPIAAGADGNPDLLFVGADADVYVRASSGQSLREASTYPGGRTIVDIALDPRTGAAFVADDRFVYMTRDSGASWVEITGDLITEAPGAIHALAFRSGDAPVLYVGSEAGVMAAAGPAFNQWRQLGTGLPNATVIDMEYDPVDRILAVGTLGHGTWTIDLSH